MSTPNDKLPRGRLTRLGKVVGLTARVGGGLVASGVKRALGGEGDAKVEAARKVLETLGQMKGAALKVGQTLSLGAGHLPPEVREIVAQLFSQAPAMDYAQIAAVVADELGDEPEALFASFEREPFAAASLGQVHRAVTKSGEPVAVKVQYPDVAGALDDDLRNVGTLVRSVGLSRLVDGDAYYAEVRRELEAELDYRRELALVEEFRGYLARWPELRVPRTYPELSSTRVLVLERFEGPTLHEYTKTIAGIPAAERFRIAMQLTRAVYGPFILHRVIHGDTHPGNFVVLADGSLGVLDFGSIKRFSEGFWRCYCESIAGGLAGGDIDLVSLMREGGFHISLPDERAQELLDAIAHIVGRPLLGPYDFGHDTIVEELRGLALKRATELLRVRPPPEGILFYRAVAGITHDLRALRAAGDFRPFFAELLGELGIEPPPKVSSQRTSPSADTDDTPE